jgi:hypothetical protein
MQFDLKSKIKIFLSCRAILTIEDIYFFIILVSSLNAINRKSKLFFLTCSKAGHQYSFILGFRFLSCINRPNS